LVGYAALDDKPLCMHAKSSNLGINVMNFRIFFPEKFVENIGGFDAYYAETNDHIIDF
jgi:hypothetical protein